MKSKNTKIVVAGHQAILPLDGVSDHIESFYREVIPGLYDRVGDLGHNTRLIGFRFLSGEQSVNQFIGIEIKDTDCSNFENLVQWQIDEYVLITRQNGKVQNKTPIQWNWFSGDIGEFDLDGTPVVLTALTEINPTLIQQFDDSVELIDFNPGWKGEYQKHASNLELLFHGLINRIEHYGSTSVNDMIAKPIIDILVEVDSYDKIRKEFIPGLAGPEAEYWWYEDHMIFVLRDKPMGKRVCHIHVAPEGHRLWEGITFRDILRKNPEVANQYRKLKLELLKKYKNDREKYTNMKSEFIRNSMNESS